MSAGAASPGIARRYRRDAGIGTVIALMVPYRLVLTVAWTRLFIACYVVGIPAGPGRPIR